MFAPDPNNTSLILPPNTQRGPLNLNVNAFLGSEAKLKPAEVMDPEAVRVKVLQESPLMCQILTQRLSNLRVLKMFWLQGNVKGAVMALVKMNDLELPVAVDFFNCVRHALVWNNPNHPNNSP